MRTLLITGGAGFSGSNLIHFALAHTSDAIVVVDKTTCAVNPPAVDTWRNDPRITFIRADIADDEAAGRTLAAHRLFEAARVRYSRERLRLGVANLV